MPKRRLQYQVLRPLAAGGIAKLVLAMQPDGTRLVLRALKRIYLFHYRMHRRFVRGTKIREQLAPHKHIVAPLERGYIRFQPYEVIEYVPGANLMQLIQQKHHLLETDGLLILHQLAQALAHMHELGALHLDLKASNVLVNETGGKDDRVHTKLTDFDLSRHAENARLRSRVGTARYMAPEVITEGRVCMQSDVFGFGLIAYQMVAGKPPFPEAGGDEAAIARYICSHPVKSPEYLQPDLDPELAWLIMRCLQKTPTNRFSSMVFVEKELKDIRKRLGTQYLPEPANEPEPPAVASAH